MKSLISKQVERFLREQKNFKRWLAVFLCLAVVVVLGTTAALKYKGIAVTTDNEEVEVHVEEEVIAEEASAGHVHTDDCYEEREVEVLICEAAEAAEAAEGHVHDDSCYEVTGGEEKLICDRSEHSHGDDCYKTEIVTETVTETMTETDEEGNEHEIEVEKQETHEEKILECTEEEYSHDSSCYEVEGGERTLICGLEEGELEEGEGAEEISEHVHDESCYEIKVEKVLVCGLEEGELEEELLEEFSTRKECKNDDLGIIVVAEYAVEAEIPMDAELRVKQITEESDPEYYAQREAEYLEKVGENAEMDMLLDIGFYADGAEIEPKAPVSITIQMLEDQYEDGEQLNVVHFGKNETEKLNASEVENKATSFATDSFSTFAIGTSESSLVSGQQYMIHYGDYVLAHKKDDETEKNELKAVLLIDNNIVTLPNDYTKEDVLWTYTVESNNEYLRFDNLYLTLSYSSRKYSWGLSNSKTTLTISPGFSHTISGTANDNSRYLYQSNDGSISADKNVTNWTFTNLEDITFNEDLLKTTITLRRFNTINDNYNPGINNLVKVQFDLLDLDNNKVISDVSQFPEGSTVPVEHTFEVGPQGVLDIDAAMLLQMGVSVPGYTYENGFAFFWWGGNNWGDMNNVPTLRNFGEVSGKYWWWNYIGYQINPPKTPITGTGSDYVYDLLKKAYETGFNRDIFNSSDDYTTQYNPNINDKDNWVAYDPNGTLHIVLVKVNSSASYKVNFVDAYRSEEDVYSKYKQVDQLDMLMSKGEWDGSSSFDWTGTIPGITDRVPTRIGYEFTGWYLDKDANGNGTGGRVTLDGDEKLTVGNQEIDKLTDPKQQGNKGDRYYYAGWERINDKYTITKAWDSNTKMINPLMKSVEIKITRHYEGETKEEIAADPFNAERANIYELRSDSTPAWTKKDVELPRGDDDGLHAYIYEMQEVSVNGDNETAEAFVLTPELENKIYTLTNILKIEKSIGINVIKTDEKEENLANARFALYKKEGEKNTLIGDKHISGEDGIAIKDGLLIEGEYILKEVEAPNGYLLNSNEITFTVSEKQDGTGMEIIAGNAEGWKFDPETNTFTLKDKAAEMSVSVKKVSDQNITGKGLPGAEFVVKRGEEYLKSTDGVIGWGFESDADRFTTDVEGWIKDIPALPIGEYALVETKAPDGYNLREGEITFEINYKGVAGTATDTVVKWSADPTAGENFGETVDKDETIVVINSAGIELPETGGPGTVAYTFGGLAVIAFGLMYGLSMRRRREKGGMN